MKIPKISRTLKFSSGGAEGLRAHHKLATGKQTATAVTVNPGSKGSRIKGMRKK